MTGIDHLSTGPDGAAHEEILGAQNELERRGREEGQAAPLTRDQQLRMVIKYGGINPAHPVHASEIAMLRESGIGKNKQLFHEGGNTLDSLAQQIRQDVTNGPETEADVLAWLGELAAGRTPKLYERGDMDRAAYARSLPPGTTFTIQRPFEHPLVPGHRVPGYLQVDFHEDGENTRSASPDTLRAEDYELPEIPEAMPTGQYNEDQVLGRARWAEGQRGSAPRSPQQRRYIERQHKVFKNIFPGLFADLDVRIADVHRTLRELGEKGKIPANVEAAFKPLRAERDLIVLGLDTILRGKETGLARLLHESGHAYWSMLPEDTRAALRRSYATDLESKWSPLWKDGELATEVSQSHIASGSELGAQEWFSELMAATNREWATRRYAYGRTPGWIIDIAERLRSLFHGLARRVADKRALQGDARTAFLDSDFRHFLTSGRNMRRTMEAGAQFAAHQSTLDLATPLGIRLPSEIANLIPRWQARDLHFASRLDKALYYVGAAGQTALRSSIVDSIVEQTGLSDAQVRSLARHLRDRLPALVRSQPEEGRVRVPEISPALAEKMTGSRFAISEPTGPDWQARTAEEVSVVHAPKDAPISRRDAESWWREHGPRTVQRDEIQAQVTGQTLAKITAGGKPYPQARMAMITRLQELVANGARFNRSDDGRDPNVKGVVEIYAPFSFNGDLYRARMLIKLFRPESPHPDKLHSGRIEEVILENRNARLDSFEGDALAVPSSTSPGKITVGELFTKVNREAQFAAPDDSTPPKPNEGADQGQPIASARERWGKADEREREIQSEIETLKNSQADDTEEQGRALRRDLREAKRELAKTYGEVVAERNAVTLDPVEQAVAQSPAVKAQREKLAQITAAIIQAKAEKRNPEALLNQRDALHANMETIRKDAENTLYPPPKPDQHPAFGDPNPPRNDDPPAKPVTEGADEPDHLRPVRWQDMSHFSSEQLGERLTRLRRLEDGIAADDLESAARLSFLSSLRRDTQEELTVRRKDAEAEVEAAAYRSAEHAAEPTTEARPSILTGESEARAAEAERRAQASIDAEAAAAVPDAPVESYPVRDNVEQVGAEVSATTLETKSRLSGWIETFRDLLNGFRSSIPELPITGPKAQQFATLREGCRLLDGSDELVRKDAETAIVHITEPLRAHTPRASRDAQARLQELYRQRSAATTQQAKDVRTAEIRRIEGELQNDPWFVFQNTILYGDLFTRSRLYKRDDGSPVGLPGGLNPAEAEHLFKLWITRAASHPQAAAIAEARTRHKAFVERIANDLKSRGFVFAEGSNTNYFPHVMLENWDGNIARVKVGTETDFRGYLITPTGSNKPIETDYFKAMYYHAVQVMAHNQRADIVRDYIAREDIRPQLIEEAKEANRTRRDQDGPPITWQQILNTRYADTHTIFAPDPNEIPLHPELVIDRDALSKRIGIVLGSGPLEAELKKAGLSNLPLQPSEIQAMLVAGNKELWVLPNEVAEALRGRSHRAKWTDNKVVRVLSAPNSIWKKNILFALHNWARFEFNNMISDGEKILVADPGMVRAIPDAMQDAYRFMTGDQKASDEVRMAFRLGVLDSITAAEVGELRALRPFEEWETTKEHNWRVAINRLTSPATLAWLLGNPQRFFGISDKSARWNTMSLSKLREATFRLAKFKTDLERLRNGATPKYGGAYWKNVEALQRIGAPENIHEDNRLGRGMGRTGPGSGAIMSANPYVLKWREAGLRREEAYATSDQRSKKRHELEAQQAEADRTLLARKAAAISLATFGDYRELTPNGNVLRKLIAPFWAWNEVNFRYHANMFRNMRDMVTAGEIGPGSAAAGLAKQGSVAAVRALIPKSVVGMFARVALLYVSAAIWNSFTDYDEDELSEEDRRKLHLVMGRDDDGTLRVVHLSLASADLMKWFSGNRATGLISDAVSGRTDWGTAAEEWVTHLLPDAANNVWGAIGPVIKAPYTKISGQNSFPDVLNQRTIPAYDLNRIVINQMTDDTMGNLIAMAMNKDFVAPKSVGEWAQQAILQVRRRNPDQWAFYAIKEKAAEYEYQKTGKADGYAANNALDAQIVRQFRRAIYQGDVPTAMRMYQRLLDLGYTADRFESSIKSQEPLYGLPKALRAGFMAELNDYEKSQLARAYRYYLRIQEMEGAGRQLFPKRGIPERARERFMQRDRSATLAAEMERAIATQASPAELERRTQRELQQAQRRN